MTVKQKRNVCLCVVVADLSSVGLVNFFIALHVKLSGQYIVISPVCVCVFVGLLPR